VDEMASTSASTTAMHPACIGIGPRGWRHRRLRRRVGIFDLRLLSVTPANHDERGVEFSEAGALGAEGRAASRRTLCADPNAPSAATTFTMSFILQVWSMPAPALKRVS